MYDVVWKVHRNEKDEIVYIATFVDPITQETFTKVYTQSDLEKIAEYQEKRRKRKHLNELYGGKAMVFQEILKKAVKELKNDEYRLFGYMLGVMTYENWIAKTQREMAKELDFDERRIRRALKGLREKGYIEVYKTGRQNVYRINPEIAWKGSEKNHLKVLKSKNPLID